MLLAPSEDVVVFPPLLALEPGEQRNLRVGALVPGGAKEKTYRVFIQELLQELPEAPPGVRVVSRIGIPVFLPPARPVTRTAIEGPVGDGGSVRFRIRNDGTVHVRPNAVRLVASDGEGRALVERDLHAWYVLSGGERAYRVELPAAVCPGVRRVSVAVELGGEVLRSHAEGPLACGS
jgi:fimbrial chaperone protein